MHVERASRESSVDDTLATHDPSTEYRYKTGKSRCWGMMEAEPDRRVEFRFTE